MFLRKVFLGPFLVKKSPIFKHCLCSYHVSYADNVAIESKPFVSENRNKDKLKAELNTLSTSNILIALENNKKLVNGHHLVYAWKQFYKLYRQRFFDQEDGQRVWDNKNAMKMCSLIDTNIDKLKVSEAVQLLDFFRKMKAPSSMKVVQSLYKYINKFIKDLVLVDFPIVSLALKEMPESSLAKELHSTLVQKFIIKVSTEYDPRNIEHLERCLYFTAYNMANNKLLTMFISDLNKYTGQIPTESAVTIFNSLNMLRQSPPGYFDLLKKIQNYFIEHVNEFSAVQIEFILYLMSEKCRKSLKEEFYNETLCDVFVKKIVADDSGFDRALKALKSLKSMRHINTELLNYTCATFFEKIYMSDEVIQHDILQLTTLINCLSLVKHKSVFFDEIRDHLLSNKSLWNCNYEVLCTLALNLISLDCYSTELLSKVFDEKVKFAEKNHFLHWTIVKIYQKVKTNPSYKGPLPSESQIAEYEKFHSEYLLNKKTDNSRVLSYLEEGMGAPIYIKSNISSKLFHVIDCAVAFSKDGSPIPINTATNIDEKSDSIEYIEDLEVPPESQIVLILIMPNFWFTRNTNELTSFHSCRKETLEALSYSVICINEKDFDEIPDDEKTATLMSQIRSKIVKD